MCDTAQTTARNRAILWFGLPETRLLGPSADLVQGARFGGWAMESRMRQGPRGSVSSKQLGALLDKLVAVQMDLEPICGLKGARVPVVLARDVIASACEVLHSAIADLGKIVHQVDGLIDLPEAAATRVTDRLKKQESSHDAP